MASMTMWSTIQFFLTILVNKIEVLAQGRLGLCIVHASSPESSRVRDKLQIKQCAFPTK